MPSTQAALPSPPAAAPQPAPKDRDFKPALARVRPPAAPNPARAAPAATPPATAQAPAIGAVSTPTQAAALRAWEGRPNAAFRQRIAEAERSAEHQQDGHGLRNASSGALGRYQFVPMALRDIGWMDAEGGWTEAPAGHGVANEGGFLAGPAAQEAAMSAFLARQGAILDRGGTSAVAGKTITGLDGSPIALTEGALVAAAHRRGVGMLAQYLAQRRNTPDAALTPARRSAFESVEHRLRGFAQAAYVSERPGNRRMARRGGPAA